MAASAAVSHLMDELREKGTTRALVDRLMPVTELTRLTGIDGVWDLEKELMS